MFRSLKPRWRLRQHEIWLFWRIFLYGKMKSSSYFLCYELMNLDSHWIPAMINDGVLLVKAIASNIFDSPAIRHGATGACAVRYIYIYIHTYTSLNTSSDSRFMKWHLCCHLQLQRSLKIFMSRYLSFRPWLSRLYHPAVQRVSPSYQVSCLLWVRGNRECVKTWHGVLLNFDLSSSAHGLPSCTIFRIRALMLLGKVTSRLSLHLR